MVKVTVADVVKQERVDEQGRSHPFHVIVLHDEAGQRALAIWLGPFEGESIAMGLGGFSTSRPLTFSFFASLLQAIDARVEEVRVETLQGATFIAVVKIRSGASVHEVDARPSDAMALAILTGSPIFVAEAVFERAGENIPPTAKASVTRTGMKSILREIEELWQVQAQTPRPTEEEISKAAEELMAHVFSVEG